MIESIKNLNKSYWITLFILFFERAAWWNLLIQLPVYIAQKDIQNGLYLSHIDKAIAFAVWAISQNLTSLFFGNHYDNYGFKKTFIRSFIFTLAGYLLLYFTKTTLSLSTALFILGIGSGLMKPMLQAIVAENSNNLLNIKNIKNSNISWGLYLFTINFSIFIFGTPISFYLKELGREYIFIGSAIIFSITLIFGILLFNKKHHIKNVKSFKVNIKELLDPKLMYFLLPISGFMFIYMQFYEVLPNYIYDWINTKDIISFLNISDNFTTNTSLGKQVSYEWIYNLNTFIILILTPIISYYLKPKNIPSILAKSIFLASLGFVIIGLENTGKMLLIAILVYTIGELITNIFMTKYISSIAKEGNYSRYLGYLSLASLIGYVSGSFGGNYIYQYYGDKNTIIKVNNLTNINYQEIYNKYNPEYSIIIFAGIGLLSALGMYFYSKIEK